MCCFLQTDLAESLYRDLLNTTSGATGIDYSSSAGGDVPITTSTNGLSAHQLDVTATATFYGDLSGDYRLNVYLASLAFP